MNHTTDQAPMSRGAELEKKLAETPRQLFLPGFERGVHGAMPNDINRSSLFAPVARGRRKKHWQQLLVTRSDCVLEYTGEQLDEADADIVMTLLHFAQAHPIGETVHVHVREVLRHMGRSAGKSSLEWLKKRTKAMTASTFYIEGRRKDGTTRYRAGKLYALHMLQFFAYDEEAGDYIFAFDSRWVTMFAHDYFSLIDWQKRLQIGRGQDMAKALQRLVATSSNSPQRYALDWLQAKMAYQGRVRDFREALGRACRELEGLDIIARFRIEESKRGGEQLVLYVQHEHRNQHAPRACG